MKNIKTRLTGFNIFGGTFGAAENIIIPLKLQFHLSILLP